MKHDPNIQTQEETVETTEVVMTPTEDEWDNIHGDLILF